MLQKDLFTFFQFTRCFFMSYLCYKLSIQLIDSYGVACLAEFYKQEKELTLELGLKVEIGLGQSFPK